MMVAAIANRVSGKKKRPSNDGLLCRLQVFGVFHQNGVTRDVMTRW
jgi:hypothetical protein